MISADGGARSSQFAHIPKDLLLQPVDHANAGNVAKLELGRYGSRRHPALWAFDGLKSD